MAIIIYIPIILLTCLFYLVHATRQQCCKDLGVPETCYSSLCNPTAIPEIMTRYRLFEKDKCQDYLLPVSQCLAKGRDVSKCCYKNSYDIEFDSCFGLCNGTMKYDVYKKSNFLSCFLLNIEAIFPCLVEGYSSSPSEPRDLKIVEKTKDSATIQWKEPVDLPDLVSFYKIYLIKRTDGLENTSTFDTKDLEFELEDLSSTSSYSVHVVAYADQHKSKLSNILLFTTGPQIVISSDEIELPPQTRKIAIPCELKKILGFNLEVQWIKYSQNGEELLTSDDKYNIVTYSSQSHPETILSSLLINEFSTSDYATYRCYIKDTQIEYAETKLTKTIFLEEAPNDDPPDTLLECCKKGLGSSSCGSLCNGEHINRLTLIRPGLLVPLPSQCKAEIGKLFKCTASELNSSGCCIQAQVPYHCMGMCDTRYDLSAFKLKTCQKWMRKVYECQFEKINLKPEAVSFVKVKHLYEETFRFSWDKALDAKVYHVYTRKDGDTWTSRVTIDIAVDITDANEIAPTT
uniref:Fibronectin type-III domain-containing protein n=1 Tax=Caenorhabditis japonica TaxID=281687 RepID=A0A8R1DJB9_CAEJA